MPRHGWYIKLILFVIIVGSVVVYHYTTRPTADQVQTGTGAYEQQEATAKKVSAEVTPQGNYSYSQVPVEFDPNNYKPFAPHEQFNTNMDVAEAWYRAHQTTEAGWFYYRANEQSPINAACLGLRLMIKHQKLLRISDRTLRAKYARLWGYYNWSKLSYDQETELMLKGFAGAIPGVKYKTPKAWQH